MQILNDFIDYVKKAPILPAEKIIAPLMLDLEWTVINHNFFVRFVEFNFNFHTQTWLVPELLSQ